MWIVMIATGAGVGITGAWLDVLVQWYVLSDKVCDVNHLRVVSQGWETSVKDDVPMDCSIIKWLVVVA
jgi:hypothetical protein